jgi:hypothetical protein
LDDGLREDAFQGGWAELVSGEEGGDSNQMLGILEQVETLRGECLPVLAATNSASRKTTRHVRQCARLDELGSLPHLLRARAFPG